MTNLVRAKPKPMPENWEEVGKAFGESRNSFVHTEAFKAWKDNEIARQVPVDERGENFWIGRACRALPTRQECYSVFETFISDKVRSLNFFNPKIHVFDPDEGFKCSHQYLVNRAAFLDCWVKCHTNYSPFLVYGIHSHLEYIPFEAWVGFLSGSMNVEACYAKIDEEYDFDEKRAIEYLKAVEGL